VFGSDAALLQADLLLLLLLLLLLSLQI